MKEEVSGKMNLNKMFLVLIFSVSFLVQAQYMGGNGKGDVSISLINIPLPVEEVTSYLPTKFNLEQNYPNPFNPSTVISYQLPVGIRVTLKVFDIIGNEVATLVNTEKPAGNYQVQWDSREFPSGVYFYTLSTGNFFSTKKMILLK